MDWNSAATVSCGTMNEPNPDYSDRNPALGEHYPSHIGAVRDAFDAALGAAGASHCVVFSGALHYAFLDDRDYPFRPNPHFLYWAPLNALPQSYIVYTPGETPTLIYYQPHDYWNPVPGEPEGYWTAHFDVRIVHRPDDVADHLPESRDNCILIGEIPDDAHAHGIDRVNPTTALNVLHWRRGTKTEYELACMRLASRRGVAGHVAAEAAFRDGRSEFGIHQAYCKAVSLADNELPYNNIVALNEHGAVLHYTLLDRQPAAESRSFLIDAGAQVHGYAADITRSYSREDSRFAELIDRVDAMQLELVSHVRAGVSNVDLHLQNHALLATLLIDAGLAHGEPDALVDAGVTRAFFPHGIGHLLGLQVHDVGGFQASESGGTVDTPDGHPNLRLTRELLPDMVLTIEPGLYVIDTLLDELRGTDAKALIDWDAVDWLRPFGGIRIEDNVRVLPDGSENLTRDAFAAT